MNPLKTLYKTERLPVFQNRVYHSCEQGRACVTGNVELVQNLSTGLVYNRAFQPELMIYDADYQNEQAVSKFFQTHLASVIDILDRHFTGHSLIEVGCGKGLFLEMLHDRGYKITGLDPAYEGANPAILKEYFTPQSNLRGDGIILRHVLEHIHDPVAFLRHLRDSNGGGGKIYIEVPCLEWICCHHAWFDIFYEHVNYFRLSDFHRIFGKVYEAGHSFNGQYLSIVADLASVKDPVYDGVPLVFPNDFEQEIKQCAQKLSSRPKGQKIAVWGGSSKGVIFSLHMERAGAPVDAVVDINPAKQGKYLAVTGLQVCSPPQALENLPPGSDIIVMNGNYLEEIRQLTNGIFNYHKIES